MENLFAETIKNEARKTFTENGATAYNSTGEACLDLFGSIGALRERDPKEVEILFAEALKEDKLFATKILFYARDIREGCGERKVFRDLIRYLAKNHPECLRPNLDLIGGYGRFDDLYALIETPLEKDMWKAMKDQFEIDLNCLENDESVTLLGKWIATPDASSNKTRKLGIETALNLGYRVGPFKRLLRQLRTKAKVVESLMSTGQWDKIDYPSVPSRAMMIYRNAFVRHDETRFSEYINKALNGEEKINSSTLFPYDIIEKYLYGIEDNNVLEAQWRQLPDYVDSDVNAMVVADVSGSMDGRPLATSIGLAMYFAEHNKGAFHNLFMTFSEDSDIVELKGETLDQKVKFLKKVHWDFDTNLEAAFDKVLDVAVTNNIPKEEMIKSLIIVSDMEINQCTMGDDWSFYDSMKRKYNTAGYELPNVVFWNVNSRHNVFHADANRKGVQLCSGQSPTLFKQLINCIDMTPMEMMKAVIDSDRYSSITIEE